MTPEKLSLDMDGMKRNGGEYAPCQRAISALHTNKKTYF